MASGPGALLFLSVMMMFLTSSGSMGLVNVLCPMEEGWLEGSRALLVLVTWIRKSVSNSLKAWGR